MKRIGIIFMVLVLTLSLAACRGNDTPATSDPSGSTTGVPSTLGPGSTLAPNIPDPSVNGNSTTPDMTGANDATGGNGSIGGGSTAGSEGMGGSADSSEGAGGQAPNGDAGQSGLGGSARGRMLGRRTVFY